jgi:hypothetical protein
VILFLHRDVVGGFSDEKAELIIAKQPGGPTGTIYLACCDKHARFENMTHRPFSDFDAEPDFGTIDDGPTPII